VHNAEDNLRRVMAIPENDPMWQTTIVPTETPISERVPIDQEQAIATAMEHRVEIANARQRIDSATVSEKAAKNGVRHELNLVTEMRLDKTEVPSTTSFPLTALPNRSVDSTYRSSPVWFVGLDYFYPLGNRGAKADYAIAQINGKAKTTLEASPKTCASMCASRRGPSNGVRRVTAARKNVELQTKLDAEQEEFDNGMSTSFRVFTAFQTDLRNAQLSLIQALLDYNKSLADLERAKGTLLESKGMKLADDAGR
jgi:outer membrane protein TolC